MSQPDSEVAALIYEIAHDNVARQERSVDEVRARAGTVVAALGIGTAFLAGAALADRSEPLSLFTWAGVVYPILAFIALGLVLAPKKRWTFMAEPGDLITNYYNAGLTLDYTHLQLAEYMSGWHTENKAKYDLLLSNLRASLVFTFVTVAAWVADLVWLQTSIQ